MKSLRVFFVGGVMSYRALFNWISPWILVPTFLIAPIFQILLFAYIGRAARLESDEFYVIGNALQYAAIPCLFAMSQSIGGERFQETLSAILVSPAARVPLFFWRSLPVVLNGAFVAAFSIGAARAQDTTNNQTASASQTDGSAAPSANASGYGGTLGKSASGSSAKSTGTQQPGCVGPASFCDIFKGGGQ